MASRGPPHCGIHKGRRLSLRFPAYAERGVESPFPSFYAVKKAWNAAKGGVCAACGAVRDRDDNAAVNLSRQAPASHSGRQARQPSQGCRQAPSLP